MTSRPESALLGDVQRTSLAWSRSSLELLVGALLLARVAAERGGPLVAMLALVGAACSGAVAHAARRRAWSERHSAAGSDARLPLAISAVATLLALAGLLLVLLT